MNDFILHVRPTRSFSLSDQLRRDLPTGLEGIQLAEKNHPELIGTNYTITPDSCYHEDFKIKLTREQVMDHAVLRDLFKGTFGHGVWVTRDYLKSFLYTTSKVVDDGDTHKFVQFSTLLDEEKFLREIFIGSKDGKNRMADTTLYEEEIEDEKAKGFLAEMWETFKEWWRNN